MTTITLRWHTIGPQEIRAPPDPDVDPRRVDKIVSWDKGAPFLSQVLETKENPGTTAAERNKLAAFVGRFFREMEQVLNYNRTPLWDKAHVLREDFREMYGNFFSGNNDLSIRAVLAALMTHSQLDYELRGAEKSAPDRFDRELFWNAGKSAKNPPLYQTDLNGTPIDRHYVKYESGRPMDGERTKRVHKHAPLPWTGLEPVNLYGIVVRDWEQDPLPPRMACCAELVGQTEGCWIALTDPNFPSSISYGTPVPYEVMIGGKNYWERIGNYALDAAKADYVDAFRADYRIGTAFKDVSYYESLHKALRAKWNTRILDVIADAYVRYVARLQAQMDTDAAISDLDPYESAFAQMTTDRTELEVFMGLLYTYNQVHGWQAPALWRTTINERIFHVQHIRTYFTAEKRSKLIVTLPGGETVRLTRIRPQARDPVALDKIIAELEAKDSTRMVFPTIIGILKDASPNGIRTFYGTEEDALDRLRDWKMLELKWNNQLTDTFRSLDQRTAKTLRNLFVTIPAFENNVTTFSEQITAFHDEINTNLKTAMDVEPAIKAALDKIEDKIARDRLFTDTELNLQTLYVNRLVSVRKLVENARPVDSPAIAAAQVVLAEARALRTSDTDAQVRLEAAIKRVQELAALDRLILDNPAQQQLLEAYKTRTVGSPADVTKNLDEAKKTIEGQVKVRREQMSQEEKEREVKRLEEEKRKEDERKEREKQKKEAEKRDADEAERLRRLSSGDETEGPFPLKKDYKRRLSSDGRNRILLYLEQEKALMQKAGLSDAERARHANNVRIAILAARRPPLSSREKIEAYSNGIMADIAAREMMVQAALDWLTEVVKKAPNMKNLQKDSYKNLKTLVSFWNNTETWPPALVELANRLQIRNNTIYNQWIDRTYLQENPAESLDYRGVYIDNVSDIKIVATNWALFARALTAYPVLVAAKDELLSADLLKAKQQLLADIASGGKVLPARLVSVTNRETAINVDPAWPALAPAREPLTGKSLLSQGQLRWEANSCWMDAVLIALFKMPGTTLETALRNAFRLNVYEKVLIFSDNTSRPLFDKDVLCGEADVKAMRENLFEDIATLQSDEPENRLACALRKNWERCVYEPIKKEGYMFEAASLLESIVKMYNTPPTIAVGKLPFQALSLNGADFTIAPRNPDTTCLVFACDLGVEIGSKFEINEAYETFLLTSVVAFTGNHYVNYLKDHATGKWIYWNTKPYDDETPVDQRGIADIRPAVFGKQMTTVAAGNAPIIWVYFSQGEIERLKRFHGITKDGETNGPFPLVGRYRKEMGSDENKRLGLYVKQEEDLSQAPTINPKERVRHENNARFARLAARKSPKKELGDEVGVPFALTSAYRARLAPDGNNRFTLYEEQEEAALSSLPLTNVNDRARRENNIRCARLASRGLVVIRK